MWPGRNCWCTAAASSSWHFSHLNPTRSVNQTDPKWWPGKCCRRSSTSSSWHFSHLNPTRHVFWGIRFCRVVRLRLASLNYWDDHVFLGIGFCRAVGLRWAALSCWNGHVFLGIGFGGGFVHQNFGGQMVWGPAMDPKWTYKKAGGTHYKNNCVY